MLLYELNGNWQMKRVDESEWNSSKVPGSVYSDLLSAGKMEDPFYRDNEYGALELCKYDYEYKRQFKIDTDLLNHDRIVLLCEGLDTICEVYLNGTSISKSDNMHRTYEIDIKNILISGENTINVIFRSPVEYVLQKHEEIPLVKSQDYVDGIFHLRKAHCMFGWDWGPKLPDMGIWKNISIRAYDYGRIDDVYITQSHEDSKVKLDVRVRTNSWCGDEKEILVRIKAPSGKVFESRISEKAGKLRTQNLLNKYFLIDDENISTRVIENHIDIEIPEPELWWPNNFGKQPLYNVEVSLVNGSKELDTKSLRIGLRTLTIRREKDKWGESFEFVVNGVAIFSMGGDYIPEDNILARCNRDRTEKLIRSCVAANFNSIRVWGGAFYPEDYFYDLCDEYGLIVWQDMMFACGVYNMTEDFKENIAHEAVDNMKRLRHHASLGLWCGNNEQEWGWVEWGWSDKFSPKFKVDYIKQFEVLLPDIAKEIDPNTFYWRASPSSKGSFDAPNDENYGDMHFWGVWHNKKPFTEYRKIFPRYMSEFGIQSFPCLETVESFTLPEDRNIFSYVMESHQKNGTGNEKILYYIGETYRYPKDFDSLLYASQLIQAEGLRYGVEHWRRNRGRCMGAIYWQLNDCWPVASWASIDYFGRWKATHYVAKRFFAPVMVSACEEGTKVSLHVSNETLSTVKGSLKWKLLDSKSKVLQEGERNVEIDALFSKEIDQLDFENILDTNDKKRNAYLEFSFGQAWEAWQVGTIHNNLTKTSGDASQQCDEGTLLESEGTVLFVKAKHFNFEDPEIKAEISEESDHFLVSLNSKAYARFVELSFRELNVIFSDNFFDLSAGKIKVVKIDKSLVGGDATGQCGISLQELKDKLTVRSLYDTW